MVKRALAVKLSKSNVRVRIHIKRTLGIVYRQVERGRVLTEQNPDVNLTEQEVQDELLQDQEDFNYCLKANQAALQNDLAELKNIVRPFCTMVKEVIAELKLKNAVRVGVYYPIYRIRAFKKFWFVYLKLFHHCTKLLNHCNVKSCSILPVVSANVPFLSISDYKLMKCLVPGQRIGDCVKYISNYKGQPWALRTDSCQVQYVFKCPEEYAPKQNSVMNCIDVDRVDLVNNGEGVNVYEGLDQDELNGDNGDFEFDDADDGELEAGNAQEYVQHIEDGFRRVYRDFLFYMDRPRSWVEQLDSFLHAIDRVVVLPISQIHYEQSVRVVISKTRYVQNILSPDVAVQRHALQSREFARGVKTVDLNVLQNRLALYFGRFVAMREYHSTEQVLTCKLNSTTQMKVLHLIYIRTLLPLSGGKLDQANRQNYLILYESYVLEQSVVPEPMSSTICFVCLTKGIESFVVRKKEKPTADAENADYAKKLWDLSEDLTKVQFSI
ncbi:hypothetical protein MIR68_007311 [Amoeboaphelidium protococcarum]|nr:hypothetical protein MIR68_007311 [Amoeboaphelidium protococcarum]